MFAWFGVAVAETLWLATMVAGATRKLAGIALVLSLLVLWPKDVVAAMALAVLAIPPLLWRLEIELQPVLRQARVKQPHVERCVLSATSWIEVSMLNCCVSYRSMIIPTLEDTHVIALCLV